MRKPLTHDDLAFLFFCCLFAAILAGPIHDLARQIESYAATYRERCILPGTIPERPEGSGWKLTWINTRKERR